MKKREKGKPLPYSYDKYGKNFFVDEKTFVIFVLLHTDGRTRSDMLGITGMFYMPKYKHIAREWYKYFLGVIGEDNYKAVEVLDYLLKRMIDK